MTQKKNPPPRKSDTDNTKEANSPPVNKVPTAFFAGATTVPDNCHVVVGIGASAGGQGALEHLFTVMPTDCGVSFVVVMHLPTEGPSFLAEMLCRYTTMAVVTAEEGMLLQQDTVHVIPAGRELAVIDGRLRLEEPGEPHGAQHPIDRFFRSLATDVAGHAVAVVLSGFGTDGAEGVKWVKEAGGIVIVQEPGSAINPAMPNSAIATGAVDLILPAEEIPMKIAEIVRGTCALAPKACLPATLDEELVTLFAIVKARTGHDFSSYKANTVMRRIERRMAVNDVGGIGKYIALLRDNAQEAHALCQDILIGVTSFFRDPEAFSTIRREVIPRLFADRGSDEPVRIWHACCATGEEVYSMAILIREYLSEQRLDAKVLIFATDIDEVAISQARAGLYADDIEADVGEDRLRAYFTKVGGRWQVVKSLREMIVFAHHSLIKDPPFSRLDLLACRNFLIYLNPDMQKRLIALFHRVLKPEGFLFLGGAETVGRNSDLFTPVDKKWKIFRRLENGRLPEMTFPFPAPARKLPGTAPRSQRPAEAPELKPGAIAEKLLLERYSPPCVVVNEKYEVVHVSTRSNRFLELPVGEPSRDILRLAREELRPALRAAIYKAFAEQKQVVFRGVKVAVDGEAATVNVLVEPVGTQSSAEKLAMVIFEPAPPSMAHPAATGDDETTAGDETSRDMLVRQLEEQLRITHEQLRVTSEQLETSHDGFMSANEELMSINEEFQSANEELQSTNEELETSKEELQALNEELVTVNAELQGKVEELNLANSDMDNLLTSSGIATLFLDRRLTIKRFTPAMAGILNLIQADIGRPFRHLAGTIDWSGLARDAETVLEKLLPIEREVTALDDGRCYLMRVLPYRTAAGGIDGIIVTLIDISELKRAEESIRSVAMFPEENPSPVLRVAGDGTVLYANRATAPLLEKWRYAAVGKVPDFVQREVAAALECAMSRELETQYGDSDLLFMLVPITERGYVNFYGRDITEQKQMEDALKESEQRVRLKLESILSPEGDIGNLELGDIIEARSIQALVDDFYELTRMPMGLIDIKGKVLVGVGWQDVCTQFHRAHPEACRNCIDSDVQLSAGVPHGEYKIYKCKNNMWDVATPVMIGDRHFGNLFMGQFFFDDEQLDYKLFRAQAREYGFDEKEYIAAIKAVPRLSRETLNTSMDFFMKLADMLSRQSYSNLKLARSLAERDALMESLRENEERLNRAQEISHLGSWELDLVKNRLTWSDEVYRIFGLQPQEFDATYEAFLEAVHPDDQAAVDAAYSASLREGRDTYEIEHRVVRKTSGEVRIIHEKCEHLRDASGRIIRSVGMVHDISESKRVEEELRIARDQLETRVRERTQELATTVETLRGEITVREIAEERVMRLNRLYAVLSETNQTIVRTRDRETIFNDFCRIAVEHGSFKLAWVGLLDEESGELKLVAAKGATDYLDDIRITINEEPTGIGPTGISIREGTYYICNDFLGSPITRPWHKRGRAHGIRASASIALKQEGRVIGALTLYADKKDFFDHQQVELLQQMSADVSFALDNIIRETRRQEVERVLLEETAERLRATEALREKEQMLIQQSRQAAMGEMIGNIAHQWRQPLNTLGLTIQLLVVQQDLGELTRELLEQSVGKSMELIQHMSRTIDDFRNYFKPDKEKIKFNVRETIASTLSLMEGSLQNPRISVEIVAKDNPVINGYRNEFAQVLLNILINAREALVEREIADPRVTITIRNEDGRVVVTVADNAGGIGEEVMGKIFDPYFTTKGPQQGTGVGLFMSKTIIEKNMGGRLAARNIANGAEFMIEV